MVFPARLVTFFPLLSSRDSGLCRFVFSLAYGFLLEDVVHAVPSASETDPRPFQERAIGVSLLILHNIHPGLYLLTPSIPRVTNLLPNSRRCTCTANFLVRGAPTRRQTDANFSPSLRFYLVLPLLFLHPLGVS